MSQFPFDAYERIAVRRREFSGQISTKSFTIDANVIQHPVDTGIECDKSECKMLGLVPTFAASERQSK